MEFSSALALKGLAIVGVPTTAVALGVVYKDDLQKIFSSSEESAVTSLNITKWDEKIIEAIGNNSNTSFNFTLSGENNFSSFASGNETSIIFSITASTQTLNGGQSLKQQNKLNDADATGKDWTWECAIAFAKTEGSSNMREEDKNLIYKSENEGLLGKLKQPNNAELKKKMVKLCAEARGTDVNKKLNEQIGLQNLKSLDSSLENDKVKSKKTFHLKVENGKLIFDNSKEKSEEEFERWFIDTQKITKWDEALIEKNKTDKNGIAFNITSQPNPADFQNLTGTVKKEVAFTVEANDTDLKALNNSNAWTWKCIIKFEKETTVSEKELKKNQRDSLTGSGNFFEKLKTNKSLKERFIKDCARSRTTVPTSLDSNEIKTEKTFSLKAGSNGDSGKLVIDAKEFEKWFSTKNS